MNNIRSFQATDHGKIVKFRAVVANRLSSDTELNAPCVHGTSERGPFVPSGTPYNPFLLLFTSSVTLLRLCREEWLSIYVPFYRCLLLYVSMLFVPSIKLCSMCFLLIPHNPTHKVLLRYDSSTNFPFPCNVWATPSQSFL